MLPVLDGTVLRTWPRDGALAPIPLLIGTTRTEGTFWYDLVGPDGAKVPGLAPPTSEAQFRTMLADLAAIYRPEGAGRVGAAATAYAEAARARGEPTDPLPLWVAAYTDVVFRLRARECAMRHAAAGHPAYLYEFDHPLQPPAHGVPHTSEIPFVFGTYADPFFATKVGAGPHEAAVSDAMLSAWTGFARTGTLPGWNQVTATTAPLTILGGPALALPSNGVRMQELAAWGLA